MKTVIRVTLQNPPKSTSRVMVMIMSTDQMYCAIANDLLMNYTLEHCLMFPALIILLIQTKSYVLLIGGTR